MRISDFGNTGRIQIMKEVLPLGTLWDLQKSEQL